MTRTSALAAAARLLPKLIRALMGGYSEAEIDALLSANEQRVEDAFAAARERIRRNSGRSAITPPAPGEHRGLR